MQNPVVVPVGKSTAAGVSYRSLPHKVWPIRELSEVTQLNLLGLSTDTTVHSHASSPY